MLPRHEAVNNLKGRSVERSNMINTQNIVLDPMSNAMNIMKRGICSNTMIELSATHPHQSQVINQGQGATVGPKAHHSSFDDDQLM